MGVTKLFERYQNFDIRQLNAVWTGCSFFFFFDCGKNDRISLIDYISARFLSYLSMFIRAKEISNEDNET